MILHVPMKPMAYRRARASGKGVYVPAEYQEWKAEVGLLMRNQMKLNGVKPAEGPVLVRAEFRRDKFSVWVIDRENKTRWGRADLDNLFKAILDAGNGVLYEDDRQVEWINGGFV